MSVRRCRFFDEALAPAMDAWSGFPEEYAHHRKFASAPPLGRSLDSPWHDLWTSRALSRLFEWLVFRIQNRANLKQRPGPSGETAHPIPSRDELVRFFGALGMAPMVVHRCSVRTPEPGNAYWPFDGAYTGPAPGPGSIW